MKTKKKKYVVRLNIPTVLWALVKVDALNEDDAIEQALAQNEEDLVEYEDAGYDNLDAEVTSVERA